MAANDGTGNGGAVSGSASNGKTSSGTLEELLDRLGRPPSVQPVSPPKLARNLEKSFGAGSDAVPQLLTALRPELSGALYRAWEQTGAQQGPSAIHAFRVNDASPFGHNAPLKPILAGDGRKIID